MLYIMCVTVSAEVNQIDTLIYTMGDEAEDILCSFRLTAEQGKMYATVVESSKDTS